ncbi:LisH domain-containing protein [Balamuthia mandrillaris]
MELRDAVHLVQQFLYEHGFVATLSALADESGVKYETHQLKEGGQLMNILTAHHEMERLRSEIEPQYNAAEMAELLQEGDKSYVNTPESTISDIHSKAIIALSFSPEEDKPLLASAAADSTVALLNYETNQLLSTIDIHKGGVLSVAFHPKNSNLLLTAAMDGYHNLVDVSDPSSPTVRQQFKEHSKYVVRVSWSPDGEHFATCSYDHSVAIYELEPEQRDSYVLKKRLNYPTNPEAIQFTPDGETLIVAVRDDNYLHYVNVHTFVDDPQNMNAQLDDHVSFSAMDLAISPDAKYILVATDKDRIIMFRLGSSQQLRNFYGNKNDGFSHPRVQWHPSGKYIYCTSQKSLLVYDVATQMVIDRFTEHDAMLRDIKHHPSKNMLASCSYDKSIKFWTHFPKEES